MIKGFRIFPIGAIGIALLLLRIAIAGVLAAFCILTQYNWQTFATLLCAAALVTGMRCRLAALVAALLLLVQGAQAGGFLGASLAMHSLAAIAVFLLGPGGYSVDARLFGRRVVQREGRSRLP